MRIVHLGVSGFRGLPRPIEFDLDADAVLLVGVNGSGKTSFFDAILWALSGRVDRIDQSDGSLVSKYSPSGEARVEVILRPVSGPDVRVVRRYDGRMHLNVSTGTNAAVTGPAAEAALIELLWPDASSAADPAIALGRSLTRATYLQQDAVREFVSADDEKQRFQVVGELVGIGRVSDLQRQLESGRNAWTRGTTALENELEPLLVQRSRLRDRLSRLPERGIRDPSNEVAAWKRECSVLLLDGGSAEDRGDEDLRGDSVDAFISELTQAESLVERRIDRLHQLADMYRSQPESAPDPAPLDEAVQSAERALERAQAALADIEALVAQQRRLETELRDTQESLRALATLAQRHLGETCPVCGQSYDVEATRRHLHAIEVAEVPGEPAAKLVDSTAVANAARAAEVAERYLSEQRERARAARAASLAVSAWTREVAELQRTLGLSIDARSPQVDAEMERAQARLLRTRAHRAEGERLSLEMARASESAQREEVVRQLAQVELVVKERQEVLRQRSQTAEEVSAVILALRTASESLVADQLELIEPLLQRIFASVDPHPTFRAVSFLTRTERGQGRLWTRLADVPSGVSGVDPATVLSSSQLNVLAVSVFLAFNLAIPTLPLQMVALDDPLQSLDNVNLLGLTDLLRRTKESRQVIISTHDQRLADLLERKLRPIGDGARTVRIDLRGWSVTGPAVESSDVPADSSQLKVVVNG